MSPNRGFVFNAEETSLKILQVDLKNCVIFKSFSQREIKNLLARPELI